jgi:hypothetical protein
VKRACLGYKLYQYQYQYQEGSSGKGSSGPTSTPGNWVEVPWAVLATRWICDLLRVACDLAVDGRPRPLGAFAYLRRSARCSVITQRARMGCSKQQRPSQRPPQRPSTTRAPGTSRLWALRPAHPPPLGQAYHRQPTATSPCAMTSAAPPPTRPAPARPAPSRRPHTPSSTASSTM